MGLSSAQHSSFYTGEARSGVSGPLADAFQWDVTSTVDTPTPGVVEGVVFDEEDRVPPVHPVFVLPWGASERVRGYFEGKQGL